MAWASLEMHPNALHFVLQDLDLESKALILRLQVIHRNVVFLMLPNELLSLIL